MANFFGINLPIPQFSLPKISLPSLPKLPQITLPNFSLPSLPKIDLPKVSLPALPKLPSLPGVSLPDFSQIPALPKQIAESGSQAVSNLNLALQGILPIGMSAGSKAAQAYIEEQTRLARWAAEAAAEAAGAVGGAAASLPKVSLPKVTLPDLPKVSLPKVSLPKVSLPKVSLPDVSKVSLPDVAKATIALPGLSIIGGAGAAVAGAVARGELPKVDLPKIALPDLPKVTLPKIDLPKPAWSGAGTVPGRIITPEEAARSGIPTGGVTVPAGGGGGNLIDTIIGARDQSYADSISHIGAGNIPRGGAQFGATAAADVLLPMDLADAANKWATGRGDQIDGELALWAAIDAVTLAAAPFTFGASYAAGRALKAAKVAGKTVKVGGEVGKLTAITKAIGALQGAGKASGAAKAAGTTKTAIKPLKVAAPGKVTSNTSNISALMRKQAEAAQKQYASLQKQMQAQYSKMMSSLKAPKSAPVGASKGLGAAGDAAQAAGKTSNLSKTGTALKTAGLTLGVGAIGLTALGALGGPAQAQEVPPGEGNGGEYPPGYDPGYFPGHDPGIAYPGSEAPWWTMPDLPGFEFPEIPGFEPPTWEEYPYPDGDGGYTDEYGNYPPAYPDPFGLEDYGQGLFGAAEEVPVVGGLAHAIRSRGLTVPVIVGVLVLVILFLRSKKGKKMIGDVKKKVGSATKGAKKAVGA